MKDLGNQIQMERLKDRALVFNRNLGIEAQNQIRNSEREMNL